MKKLLSFLFQKHQQDKKSDTCWQTPLNLMAGRLLATSCKILVASTKFSAALATRKAQFQNLHSLTAQKSRKSDLQPGS